MKKFGLLMAIVFALLAFSPNTPVSADHARFHWGHGYAPNITWNWGTGYVHNATTRWHNAGFRAFVYTNNDIWNSGYSTCNSNAPLKGKVQVCWAGSADSRLQGSPAIAHYRLVNNPYQHLDSIVIYVCTNCGRSSAALDQLTTHEMGHAVGLHHTGVYSTMRWDAPTTGLAQHETDAICALYNGHSESGGYAKRCFQ